MENLEDIESRLEGLESVIALLYGQEPKDTSLSNSLAEELQRLKLKLTAIISSREKLKQLLSETKYGALKEITDPSFIEELGLSDDSKWALLKSSEPVLRLRLQQLQDLKSMEHVLDSEHIRNVGSSLNPLAVLSQKQQQQSERVAQHTSDVSALVDQYNHVIMEISKQFVRWDMLLTQLEIDQQSKP